MVCSPLWTVHCDRCSQWDENGVGDTSAEARRNARSIGWRRRRVDGELVDLCPSCAAGNPIPD